MQAIAEDNKDSVIQDRLDKATKESESLNMGAVLLDNKQGSVQDEPPMTAESVIEPVKEIPPADENESPAKKAMRAGMQSAKK